MNFKKWLAIPTLAEFRVNNQPDADARRRAFPPPVIPRTKFTMLSMVLASVIAVMPNLMQRVEAASFLTGNPMSNIRSRFTTTLLQDGRVLVAGGSTATSTTSGITNSAELYNPATGTWLPTGKMTTTRYEHSATLLPNGDVLVVGGVDNGGTVLSNAEIFNLATGKWTNTTALNQPRNLHTATLLPNGSVLVAGGTYGGAPLTSTEIYDPASGSWKVTNSMIAARWNHATALLTNGTVLAVGGYNGNPMGSAEIYDPVTGTWTAVHSMNTNRDWLAATLLSNGKVLVSGGSNVGGNGNGGAQTSAEIYDRATDTWTMTGAMSGKRYEQTSTLLPSGQVLVTGGTTTGTDELLSAELYDPTNGTWSATATMNTGRRFHTATLLPNLRVLIAGGTVNSSENYSNTVPLPTTITLVNSGKSPGGAFQFSFTNTPGASFSVVIVSTLPSSPTNWALAGAATEVLPGRFQFTDSQTGITQRFYRVQAP